MKQSNQETVKNPGIEMLKTYSGVLYGLINGLNPKHPIFTDYPTINLEKEMRIVDAFCGVLIPEPNTLEDFFDAEGDELTNNIIIRAIHYTTNPQKQLALLKSYKRMLKGPDENVIKFLTNEEKADRKNIDNLKKVEMNIRSESLTDDDYLILARAANNFYKK